MSVFFVSTWTAKTEVTQYVEATVTQAKLINAGINFLLDQDVIYLWGLFQDFSNSHKTQNISLLFFNQSSDDVKISASDIAPVTLP